MMPEYLVCWIEPTNLKNFEPFQTLPKSPNSELSARNGFNPYPYYLEKVTEL